MSDAPIRIIIADDHPIVLKGLRELFEDRQDFQVVACCRTGADALVALRNEGADILLLDLRMPDGNGLDVVRALAVEQPPCRIVLLTAAITDGEAVEAVRLGVMGLVLKESSPDELLETVQKVHQGIQWIDRPTMTRAFGRVLRQKAAVDEIGTVLTPREIEIARLVMQGFKNREIAQKLSISEGTVKIHLHNVYEKLGIDGRLDLLLYMQEKGIKNS